MWMLASLFQRATARGYSPEKVDIDGLPGSLFVLFAAFVVISVRRFPSSDSGAALSIYISFRHVALAPKGLKQNSKCK
jgi:hypothetical protein